MTERRSREAAAAIRSLTYAGHPPHQVAQCFVGDQRAECADGLSAVCQVPVKRTVGGGMIECREARADLSESEPEVLEQRAGPSLEAPEWLPRASIARAVRSDRRAVVTIGSAVFEGTTVGVRPSAARCAIAAFCASSMARSSRPLAILSTYCVPSRADQLEVLVALAGQRRRLGFDAVQGVRQRDGVGAIELRRVLEQRHPRNCVPFRRTLA